MNLRIILALQIFLCISVIFIFSYLFIVKREEIVYIDSTELLNGYKPLVDVSQKLKEKKKLWTAHFDSLSLDVQDAVRSHEKATIEGNEKDELSAKKSLDLKQKQLYEYQIAIKDQQYEEGKEETRKVLAYVNSFLLRYGKIHHYKLILVASAGNIAYADKAVNITDEVIRELHNELAYPVKDKP